MKTMRYEDMTPEQWDELSDCNWCERDAENYSCDTADEAIERELDALWPAHVPPGTRIEIVALRPMPLPATALDMESTLESVDEEYGDPDGEWWTPTERVRAAWAAFVAAVQADYPVWQCDTVARVTVDAAAWVSEHRPDWTDHAAPRRD